MTTRRRKRNEPGRRVLRLTGVFIDGEAIDRTANDEISVPDDLADDSDGVYRVAGHGVPSLNIHVNDFLVIEPRQRGNAATGELVIVERNGKAYVGRWCSKGGKRRLLDEQTQTILEGEGLRVRGVVTVIARLGPDTRL